MLRIRFYLTRSQVNLGVSAQTENGMTAWRIAPCSTRAP
jgi:hypothetical protein